LQIGTNCRIVNQANTCFFSAMILENKYYNWYEAITRLTTCYNQIVRWHHFWI